MFAVTGALFASPPAAAHGPCNGCIKPRTAQGSDRLEIDATASRIVWNPDRETLTPGPKPYCYGCQLGLWREHVRDAPSVELLRRPRSVPHPTFEVPDAPPGRYLLALFDGSEGGEHYTWDYLTIESSAATPAHPEPADEGDGLDLLLLAAVPAAALAILGVVALSRRRSA